MKCPRCNGEGSVPYHIADDMFDETLCPLCGGTGEYVKSDVSSMQETNIEYLQFAHMHVHLHMDWKHGSWLHMLFYPLAIA